eukprot:885828_1
MTTNNMLNSEYLDWCQVMDDSTMPNHNGWAVLKDNISNLNCPLFSDGSNLSMVVGDGVTVTGYRFQKLLWKVRGLLSAPLNERKIMFESIEKLPNFALCWR